MVVLLLSPSSFPLSSSHLSFIMKSPPLRLLVSVLFAASSITAFPVTTVLRSSAAPHGVLYHARSTTTSSLASATSSSTGGGSSDTDTSAALQDVVALLTRAAETKSENSDDVVAALLDLEKWMRQKNKDDPTTADATLEALTGHQKGGSWRLIFTTGTMNTQKRTGRINYFPIKATQSFNKAVDPWLIENGIYVGDFPILKFKGDFDWTLQKSGVSKLTFDFTSIKLFNFIDIQLKSGEAASLGAKTGLGSEGNVELEKRGKRAFFNWISADDKIATARGGGGGLALWMRVDYEGGR
jgi:hypothetical protein